MVHRPLEIFFFKSPQKFKAVQSYMLWLNSTTIGGIGILQSAHKQGNPSFHFSCAGLKTQIPMHSNSIDCPKIFPVCSSFVLVIASDMHLESKSEKRAKSVDLHTAKSIPCGPVAEGVRRRTLASSWDLPKNPTTWTTRDQVPYAPNIHRLPHGKKYIKVKFPMNCRVARWPRG